jgi:transcriptional regulator with XRE-family HTH domain
MSTLDQISETIRRRQIPPAATARELRRASGLSQREVAEIVGVDRVSVARWELGLRRPRGEVAERDCEIVGTIQTTLKRSSVVD